MSCEGCPLAAAAAAQLGANSQMVRLRHRQRQCAMPPMAATSEEAADGADSYQRELDKVVVEDTFRKVYEEETCLGVMELRRFRWFGTVVTRRCGSYARRQRLMESYENSDHQPIP